MTNYRDTFMKIRCIGSNFIAPQSNTWPFRIKSDTNSVTENVKNIQVWWIKKSLCTIVAAIIDKFILFIIVIQFTRIFFFSRKIWVG